MNRRSFVQCAAALTAPLMVFRGAAAQATGGPASAAVDESLHPESARRIRKATAAAMAMQRRDWEQGILAEALVEAGDRRRRFC